MKKVNKIQELYLLLMKITFFYIYLHLIYVEFTFNDKYNKYNKYKPSYAELLDLTSVKAPHQQC